MKNVYIQSVAERIRDKTAREQLIAELDSHLSEKIDGYIDIGYTPEEAEKRAVEEMGNPDDTALPLRALHKGSLNKVLLAVQILLLLIGTALRMLPYTPFRYNLPKQTHQWWVDVISLGFFAVSIFFLSVGLRRKSKTLTLWTVAMLLGGIVIPLAAGIITGSTSPPYDIFLPQNFSVLFQGALYAPCTTLLSGFGAYTESVLTEGYLSEPVASAIQPLGAVLFLLLAGWGLFQFIVILRQEHMRKTKTGMKVLRVVKYIMIGILSADILLTAVGMVVAVCNRSHQKEQLQNERQALIQLVVHTNPETFHESILTDSGFSAEREASELGSMALYTRQGSYTLLLYHGDADDNPLLMYTRTNADKYTDSMEDYRVTMQEMLPAVNAGSKLNLRAFLDFGFYEKAAEVSHTRQRLWQENGKAVEYLTFRFFRDDDTIHPKPVTFKFQYESKKGATAQDAEDFTIIEMTDEEMIPYDENQ